MIRITRLSSCGTLGLPPDLVCIRCKPSIERANLRGAKPKRIASCTKPWDSKFASHREIEKVKVYQKLQEYLMCEVVLGDAPDDSYIYSKDKDRIDIASPPPSTVELRAIQDKSPLLPTTPEELPPPPTIQEGVPCSPLLDNEIHESNCIDSDSCSHMNRKGGVSNINTNNANSHNETSNKDTLPKSHIAIHKTQLSILKAKAELYDALRSNIDRDLYNGTNVAGNMMGFAASCVPQAGYSGIATVAPFIIGAFLENCGIEYTSKKLVSSLPCNMTFKNMVEENAVSNIMLTQESIRKNRYIYICADKGNKKGNKNLPKFICWFDIDSGKVKTFLIDCDCTDESTEDVAAALKHSLDRVFPDDVVVIVWGQCTDSGGGGTKYALKRALDLKGLTSQ